MVRAPAIGYRSGHLGMMYAWVEVVVRVWFHFQITLSPPFFERFFTEYLYLFRSPLRRLWLDIQGRHITLLNEVVELHFELFSQI